MADDNATLADKFPVVVSGSIGFVLSQLFNVVQQFFHCFNADQLASLNSLSGAMIAFGVVLWQYRNVWSRASVAKALDANSPHLTTAQAKAIAKEGPPVQP